MTNKESKTNPKKNPKKTKKGNVAKSDPKVKQIDLSGLTLTDLIGLQNALPGIIEQAKQSEKALLREKMIALAAESGFELSDVFDHSIDSPAAVKKQKRKQIGFVKAKYMNPNDSEQTWSGRGRKPKWVEAHINAGGTLEDLLIQVD